MLESDVCDYDEERLQVEKLQQHQSGYVLSGECLSFPMLQSLAFVTRELSVTFISSRVNLCTCMRCTVCCSVVYLDLGFC